MYLIVLKGKLSLVFREGIKEILYYMLVVYKVIIFLMLYIVV